MLGAATAFRKQGVTRRRSYLTSTPALPSLPYHPEMSAAAHIPTSRQLVGRTFIVAVSILGAVGLVQLLTVCWLFMARFRAAPIQHETTQAAQPDAKLFADPFSDEVAVATLAPATPGTTPPPAPPRPSPLTNQGQAPTDSASVQQDRILELVEQAKLLRERGDYYAAVTKLREANALDAENPALLAELAVTYEKMGFTEKAAECWRHIHDMGDAAGVYFSAAEAKLQISRAEALRDAKIAQPDSQQTAANSGNSENIGLGPDSRLGFGEITRTDANDPQVMRKFVLHVPVRAKPRARIDPKEVTVKVEFFDHIEGQPLQRTTAHVSSRWASPPANWVERETETLEVTYTMLKPPQGEPIEARRFYGYIASIYYNSIIQDFHSDPPRLAREAPPAHVLQDTAQ